MREKENRWRFKDVVVGKAMIVIIATIVVSVIIKSVVNWLLQTAAEAKGQISFIQIEKPVSFVFIIPAFLVSVFVIQLVLNIKSVPNTKRKSQEITAATEKQFKWHIAYSLVFGYILLGILGIIAAKVESAIIDLLMGSANLSLARVFGTVLALLLGIIIPIAITIAVTKRFNKKMCEITRTNEGLLQALHNGELESEIPDNLRNPEAMNGIIKILTQPAATTLQGAIFEYRLLCKLKAAAKINAKVCFVFSIILLIISLGIMNTIMSDIEKGISDIGAEICDGIDESRAASAAADAAKQYNNALFQGKRKAEAEAAFKARRAADQLNYNSNTYEAQKRVNEAKQAAYDAQKAAQNYYRNKL